MKLTTSEKNTFKAYKHNEWANNWHTNENIEQNKFNSTPQHKQDYSPKPTQKTGDEVAQELFLILKGPTVKWEQNNHVRLQQVQKPQMSPEELCWRAMVELSPGRTQSSRVSWYLEDQHFGHQVISTQEALLNQDWQLLPWQHQVQHLLVIVMLIWVKESS